MTFHVVILVGGQRSPLVEKFVAYRQAPHVMESCGGRYMIARFSIQREDVGDRSGNGGDSGRGPGKIRVFGFSQDNRKGQRLDRPGLRLGSIVLQRGRLVRYFFRDQSFDVAPLHGN